MAINFKYCLWLINNQPNPWEKPDKGFHTHMTIKSHLNKDQAIKLYNKIKNIQPIVLQLDSDLIEDYDDTGFNSLSYNVDTDIKPDWWHDTTHVSFNYKYNQTFTEEEKKYKPISIICQFNDIIIMKCTGHHDTWIKII